MNKRIFYITGFVLLVGIEVIIGLFFHDDFIRPYLGDVIVEWVIYFMVQIFLSGKYKLQTALGVMIFSFIVEFLQKIHIVDILGLGVSSFFRTLIGTSFAVNDLYCYAAGTAVILLFIFIERRFFRKNQTAKE